MLELLGRLFAPQADGPSGVHRDYWLLHAVSDVAIGLALTVVALVLGWVLLRRQNLSFPRVFWLFTALFVACGSLRLFTALTTSGQLEVAAAWLKLLTALLAWAAVIALARIAGDVLRLPDVAKLNEELKTEIEIRRKAEAELTSYARAMEHFSAAADAANRSKSEFLANMSHEIRTPMTAILGFADVLYRTASDSSQRHAARTIRRNGQHLLEIINDILDLSKIEAGKLELESIRCSPLQLVDDVIGLMQPAADEKHLPLKVAYAGKIPESIETDPTRVRQVLVNLLSNAIKFTQKGRVQLKLRFLSDGPQPRLQFEVSDTGVGISAEQMELLFKPFTQGDNSVTRKFGGTGLGLAISQRLAEMMGGRISAKSRVGKGSRFRVEIATGPLEGVRLIDPAQAVANPSITDSGEFKLIRLDCRVLVADDGRDIRFLTSRILEQSGADVTVVENGQQALDTLDRAEQQGKPFDVVLMDMQMPLVSGYEATAQLRRRGCQTPIIAITAHAMKHDRQKCLDAGCDEYLAKPIDHRQLLELISRFTRQSDPGAVAAQRT